MREEITFCRLCPGSCGMLATIDDDGRIASLRAQKEHVLTQGYACFKGLKAGEFHNSDRRLLRPQRRRDDGGFEPVGLDEALDDVAERLNEAEAS